MHTQHHADELTTDEIADVIEMDTDTYHQRVIALFTSGRATQAQWLAMADAVAAMRESADGRRVACIDRAVLAAGRRPEDAA